MQCNKEELLNLLEMLNRVEVKGKEAFVLVGWVQKINNELQRMEMGAIKKEVGVDENFTADEDGKVDIR